MRAVVVLVLGFVLLSANVNAGEPPTRVSIVLSPLELVEPVVHVVGEFRVARTHGIGPDVAVGSIDGAFVWALGGQYAWYCIGDFEHGMQLGASLRYLQSNETQAGISSVGRAIAIGPMVGYKYVAPFGLTLGLNGGVMFTSMNAAAEDTFGGRAKATGSGIIPTAALWIGWTI